MFWTYSTLLLMNLLALVNIFSASLPLIFMYTHGKWQIVMFAKSFNSSVLLFLIYDVNIHYWESIMEKLSFAFSKDSYRYQVCWYIVLIFILSLGDKLLEFLVPPWFNYSTTALERKNKIYISAHLLSLLVESCFYFFSEAILVITPCSKL